MPVGMMVTWAIGIGAAALCCWALVKAEPVPAKVIAGVCAALFLGAPIGLTVWSAQVNKADYVSAHGLKIMQGEVNKCEKAQVDKWGDDVITFWKKHYEEKAILDKLKGVKVFCIDQEAIGVAGRLVRGVSHGGTIGVGWNGDVNYTRSLFIHETSHHIVSINKGQDELVHHAYFSEVKLGH